MTIQEVYFQSFYKDKKIIAKYNILFLKTEGKILQFTINDELGAKFEIIKSDIYEKYSNSDDYISYKVYKMDWAKRILLEVFEIFEKDYSIGFKFVFSQDICGYYFNDLKQENIFLLLKSTSVLDFCSLKKINIE